jgi:2-methylcitrate dehydratase PrpD
VSRPSAARALGELVARTTFDQLPPETIREAKRRVADVIGAGLSGSATPVGKRIADYVAARGGAGKARVWCSNLEVAPAYAALANATMTFHLELDDVHRTSHTHPGVSVIPGALALCEEHGLSGRDLLLAIVLGYEVEIRIGLAVSPSIYVDRTYLAPGTLGAFGSAAAAAKLMDATSDVVAAAIGTASYLGPLAPFESFRTGAAAKDTIFGWTNFAGLHAAELSRHGFGGPESSLDGDFGFCRTTAERYDMDRLFRELGTRFEILYTGIKPYACCRQHHTAVDAVLELRDQFGLTAADIDRVTLRTFVVGSRGSNAKPSSVPAAKYSAPYTIAVTSRFGRAWRDQYTEQLIRDRDILDLASRVEVRADQELEALYDDKWPSIVEVRTKDGRQLTARRDLPAGEPEHALSDDSLKAKFLSLACDALPVEDAEAIWDAIFALDEMTKVSTLTALLRSGAGHAVTVT